MSDVVRAGRRSIPISHADRVVFPEAGLTKLDLARHYQGAHGLGRNYQSGTRPDEPTDHSPDAVELERWAAFHAAVDGLPTEAREVFVLTFYHGSTQAQIAELFGVSAKTVYRRWQNAAILLNRALGGDIPTG